MELLQSVKLFSLPGWLKILIAALLGLLGAINTVIFFMGILSEHREGWVKASVELLSVVLPIFLIALVLWKSEAGVESLRRKTAEFFLKLLPSVLERLVETDAPFFEAKEKHELADLHTGTRVLVNLQKDDCYSDVIVLAPHNGAYVEVAIRLEINVRKVNFNLCLDEGHVLARYAQEHPEASQVEADFDAALAQWIFRKFRHTTGGAAAALASEQAHTNNKSVPGAYQFNPNLLRRNVGNRMTLCVVASCTVARDFLYDPAERLFFAQDLMFFLRSFLTEGQELFRYAPKASIEHAVAALHRTNRPSDYLASPVSSTHDCASTQLGISTAARSASHATAHR